jgi:hypothetical protein
MQVPATKFTLHSDREIWEKMVCKLFQVRWIRVHLNEQLKWSQLTDLFAVPDTGPNNELYSS